MENILQNHIPFDPLAEVGLPGIAPMTMAEWLIVDEVYSAQIAERLRLLREARALVLSVSPQAEPAAAELLDLVLGQLELRDDFIVDGPQVRCPDGRTVVVDEAAPFDTLAGLVQEDFCLLQKVGDEHVISGAALCFPASWTLAEKFMKPMVRVHVPVPSYDENVAKRSQRLFDGVRAGRPMWRKNANWYQSGELFHPRPENAPRTEVAAEAAPYLRSERQSLVRLPKTNTVAFSIHTYLLRREDVPG